MAEFLTHPVDLVKVRMQLQGEQNAARQYENMLHAFSRIWKTEGPLALYQGVNPAVLRQATYGTCRVGLYAPLKRFFGVPIETEPHERDGSTIFRKIAAACLSGGIASAIWNPVDLVKVRMQASGLRKEALPTYRGTFHAFSSILRQEGVSGLYKGVQAGSARAMVVAAAELGSYDEIKLLFLRNSESWAGDVGLGHDDFKLHISTSLFSGFISTFVSSPFDVVKSRYMNQPFDPLTGKGIWYTNVWNCFMKSIRQEGIPFMWRGFWPNFANKGPTVVLFFTFYEQIRLFFDQ